MTSLDGERARLSQAPGSETTGHRWGFDKSRSLWTSRRLGVVFGEEAAAGIPASPIPQQACPIVMCRIVGSQHREQARRCTISSLLPRCSRSADLDPLIVKEGMRTHQPSVSRSRRDICQRYLVIGACLGRGLNSTSRAVWVRGSERRQSARSSRSRRVRCSAGDAPKQTLGIYSADFYPAIAEWQSRQSQLRPSPRRTSIARQRQTPPFPRPRFDTKASAMASSAARNSELR